MKIKVVLVVVLLLGFFIGRASAEEELKATVFQQCASALTVRVFETDYLGANGLEIRKTRTIRLDSLGGGYVEIFDPSDNVYQFFKKMEGETLK